ncbi:MAG: hypothetical protein AAGH64_08760 [Planctomycetota bacterium]
MTGGRPHTRAGFVLVDAIVAGVLLGIGLTVIIGLTASALGAQRRGEQLQRAASLADERLSMVLALGPTLYEADDDMSGAFPEPDDDFRFEVTIDDGENGDPSFVSVEVVWGERSRDRLYVETFIAPRMGDEPDPLRDPERQVERP